MPEALKQQTVKVEGMTCGHCEMTVEKAVKQLANVKSAKVHAKAGTIEIAYSGEFDLAALKANVEAAGYHAV